jgi:hypothetical protein
MQALQPQSIDGIPVKPPGSIKAELAITVIGSALIELPHTVEVPENPALCARDKFLFGPKESIP